MLEIVTFFWGGGTQKTKCKSFKMERKSEGRSEGKKTFTQIYLNKAVAI